MMQPVHPRDGTPRPPPPPLPPNRPPHVTDVKPRLTKDQHDILEAHFQHQHKPSTATKKGFAENLGVPVDKINNWFQNRRAKVKQDAKKLQNQYMNMGVYSSAPLPLMYAGSAGNSDPNFQSSGAGEGQQQQQQQHQHQQQQQGQGQPQQQQQQQPQPQPQPALQQQQQQQQQHQQQQLQQPQAQPPITQEYYAGNTDNSSSCMPAQNAPALAMGSQVSLHQPFESFALRSIPESERAASYGPNLLFNSLMAAAEGPSFMQNQAVPIPQQEPMQPFDDAAMSKVLRTEYRPEEAFPVPNGLPSDVNVSNDAFGADYSNLEFNSFLPTNGTSPADTRNGTASVVSDNSGFSGAQSSATTQSSTSSTGPVPSSVDSLTSVFSGWTDDQKSELPVESMFSHIPQAAELNYFLSSPEHSEETKQIANQQEFESLPVFQGEDIYSRRNSSTTNLASTIEAIHIQNSTPDGFKQSNQPTSIAARRQKRPTALNSNTLRSASFTSGMPSPGTNEQQTLRRIRSSGIGNHGRVQKPTSGSAQRSPMAATFSEAANSPKFARSFSSSTTATLGPTGSLAPPTPLTPSENGRFPYFQVPGFVTNHGSLPEHSNPGSLNASYSMEPPQAGPYTTSASPPSTPLELGQWPQQMYAQNVPYRDTPPQSAPATQQSFPRPGFVAPPPMRPGFHSTTDLTIAQPKPAHFRRPSLPDGYTPMAEPHTQVPVQLSDLYSDDLNGFNWDEITHNVPFAPQAPIPDPFVHHEFSRPHGPHSESMLRVTNEPQQKTFIFANQSPSDFRR